MNKGNRRIKKNQLYYSLLSRETINNEDFLFGLDPVERLSFRKGSYDIISLSTRQLIIVNQKVCYPKQLENVIMRKKKFSNIDSLRSMNKETSGLFDIGFISRNKAVLIDLSNGEVARLFREVRVCEARSFKNKICSLGRDSLLDASALEVCYRGGILFSTEWFQAGLPFGELSKASRVDTIKQLLIRNQSIDRFNDQLLYENLKLWYNSRRLEIDQRYRRMFDSIVKNNKMKDAVNGLIFSHRDLTEHNSVFVDGRLIYVDFSPFKIGLAPWWYDPLTLIQTEGSEYGRYDLLEVYLRGGFDCYLRDIIPLDFEKKPRAYQVRYRLDILIVACMLMLFYPFKIKPARVTSWLGDTYSLFKRIIRESNSDRI